MKFNKHIALGCSVMLLATGCTMGSSTSNDQMSDAEKTITELMMEVDVSKDDGMKNMDDLKKNASTEMEYDLKGKLDPVDGSNASGTAMAVYKDGEYMMRAEIENLVDPPEGFFYEGWVVRKEPFKFISTGKLEKEGDNWVNVYTSETDYSDFIRYVLTIEPDDNDPAPADHVVEGDMMKIEK